jgi:HEPN domain-containing protein
MKIILDQKSVYQACLENIPAAGPDGKPASWSPAPAGTRSILLIDGHRDAPRGFGLRVQKSTKTYFAEKKVNGKNIRFKLGDAKGIKLEDARQLAHEKLKEVVEHGESPNKIRKARLAAEITLKDAWDDYISSLNDRRQKPKPLTFDNIEKARTRLAKERPSWEGRKIRTLTGQEVIDAFNAIAKTHRTTAEQVGRWASAAIRHAITLEVHDAQTRGVPPSLTYDPFSILGKKNGFSLYRTRAQMEEDYTARGVRNPMDGDSLGKFIRACWAYRRQNPLGADFLLITLLLGARRGESCKFVWRDRVDSVDASTSSYIDMVKRVAHFHDPKNRISFDQPIGPCAMEILRRRQEETVSKWVFPARDSRAIGGYYKDPQTALKTVKSIAGLDDITLRTHDLRRTLGRVAESLNFSERAIKNLLGHSTTDATSRYTNPEWKTRVERMERVEYKVLSSAPDVYNDLKPTSKRPMDVKTLPPMLPMDRKSRKSRSKEASAIENAP